MNQPRNKFRATWRFWVAYRSVPIRDGGTIRVGVKVTFEMRIELLANDHVGNAIAIQIRGSRGVRLGERDAGVLGA